MRSSAETTWTRRGQSRQARSRRSTFPSRQTRLLRPRLKNIVLALTCPTAFGAPTVSTGG
eukprot:303168-Heterocapsa_arctica.AAC.1